MSKGVLIRVGILFGAFAAFLMHLSAVDAAEPSVTATVDKQSLVVGDSLVLSITVEGIADPEMPVLPEIQGFDVRFLGRRQQGFSSVTVIVNGKKIQDEQSEGAIVFDYEFVPKAVGNYAIPAFSVDFTGTTYTTQPISIEVVEHAEASQDIFLQLSLGKDRIYLGESVVFEFKWYLSKNIDGYRCSLPWLRSLKNLLVTDPELAKGKDYLKVILNGTEEVIAEQKRENVKGIRYTVLSFKKILTPLAVGTYTFDPAFVRCDIIVGYKKRGPRSVFDDDWFSGFDRAFFREAITETVTARSNPLTLKVLSLPDEDKPDSFQGAVGAYDFKLSAAPRALKVGDPVTVTMEISGRGNLEEVKVPRVPITDVFKIYEPESRLDATRRDGVTTGKKVFELVLVPHESGQQTIPQVQFSFFNPEKERYETITQGPLVIDVEEAPEDEREIHVVEIKRPDREGKEIEIIQKDIRYIKTELGRIQETVARPFYGSIWFVVCGVLFPPLLFFSGYVVRRRWERLRSDVAYARAHQADRRFRRGLNQTRKFISRGLPHEFYPAIARVLRQYLSDKLGLPPAALPAEFVIQLESKGVDAESIEELKTIFDTCDMVQFSSVAMDKEEMKPWYGRVDKIVSKLERYL